MIIINMSSARSVASARAKRAGLSNDPPPNKSNLSNNSKHPNSSETITIPNAITLITLRLGKLETYIQTLETDTLPTLFNQTPSTTTINNSNLEAEIYKLSTKISQVELENVTLKNKLISLEERLPQVEETVKTQVQEINNEITQIKKNDISSQVQEINNEITQIKKNDISSQVQEINNEITQIKKNDISSQVQEINNEITQIKNLLMYLQHSSLEVNEKIINILFNNMNDVILENDNDIQEEEQEEQQEIVQEVVQEVSQEVQQEVVQEVQQEVVQEVVQEVQQEVVQEIAQEVVQEVTQEVVQEVV